MKIDIYTDGACNNRLDNSPMGIGVVAYVEGVKVLEKAKFVGEGTSNIAEWYAFVLGLKAACLLIDEYSSWGNYVEVRMYADSQLIVNQFYGNWLIKKPEFMYYYKKAKQYEHRLGPKFKFLKWIPREKNTEADLMSKQGRAMGTK